MFTDTVKLTLRAGRGGNGVVAWRREKYIPKGGPYGGNGGRGGSIILEVDPEVYSLDYYRNRRLLKAENGKDGSSNRRQGAQGKNLTLRVPCGTLVKDSTTGEILHDLTEPGQTLPICDGGKGGIGNAFFKTPTNQAPNKSTPGKMGHEMGLELELKLIADVGFVGLPNAGKSTLMKALSGAQVKTAAYPFTTLSPNLGFVQYDDYSRVYLADIPGIIRGAHANKGLGHAFLKHIERNKALVFVLDASDDPERDLQILRDELAAYSPETLEKPSLIILNKIDLAEPEFEHEHIAISALDGEGLPQMLESLKTFSSFR